MILFLLYLDLLKDFYAVIILFCRQFLYAVLKGSTYRVRDLGSAELRQVTRDQMKVNFSFPREDKKSSLVPPLPRLATQGESAKAVTDAVADVLSFSAKQDAEPQALSEPGEPDSVAMAPLDLAEPTPLLEGRYGLRPVAARRAGL